MEWSPLVLFRRVANLLSVLVSYGVVMLKPVAHSILQMLCILTLTIGSAQPGFAEKMDKTPVPEAEASDDGHTQQGHAESGVPINFKMDLALWSLIVFVLFVAVLKTFAWGPLSSALDARERKIKSDIASAEEARIKAEKMLAEYQAKLAAAQDEILKTLAEARRDAEHTRQDILAQAEKEVSATKDRALLEIERTKDQALNELFNHMAGAVANATERVLGRALTDADQERLIGDAIAEYSRN